MRRLCLTLLVWTLVSVANGVENNTEFDLNKTFLTTYCVSCHGNEKSKGDHNFENFSDKDWNNQELLDELLMVVEEEEIIIRELVNGFLMPAETSFIHLH